MRSLEELADLAEQLLTQLGPGSVVLLEGPLGVGKTAFVKAALRSLRYLGAVRSPTFNLIQTFDTEPPVLHADLYRLESAAGLGLDEYFDSHLCFIEWPDRLESERREGAWTLSFSFGPEDSRIIRILAPGSSSDRLS